jgi:predicted phage tail protein
MAMKEDNSNACPSLEAGATVHSTDMRETARALELAMAQIDMSLRDSDHAVEALIDSITAMAACVRRIEQRLDDSCQHVDTAATRASVLTECDQSKNSMQKAISAFQFYDLLSQRFMHIRDNLNAVAEVMRAPDRQHPSMWRQLNEKLQSVYSLEQEQTMYQALLSGLSAEKVVKQADVNKQDPCGDIELF